MAILQIIFLTLKLTGVITWPWFYVFLPTIIYILGLWLVVLLLLLIMVVFDAMEDEL